MTRRGLLIIGIVLALLIAAPIAIVYYVGYTEGGLQFIVKHVPRRIARAQLTFDAPRGTLVHGFEIGRFELDHPRVHLRFEGITGRLVLRSLLWQTIDARDVTMRSAFVQVRRRTEPSEPYTPHFLPRGVAIRLDRGRVAAATLIATNGRRFDATRLETSGVAYPYSLRFFNSSMTLDAMRVTGRSELRAADPLQLTADAHIRMNWPGQPLWMLDTSAQGDLAALHLNARLTAPFRADFAGQARQLTGDWNWSGNATIHDFDLHAWGGGGALGRITGTLALKGAAPGFSARGPLTPEGLHSGAFESVFQGNYADHTVSANHFELRHASGAVVEGSGNISVVANGPRLDLRGVWHDFRWPLLGRNIVVHSPSGEYTLSGLWPYEWNAVGSVAIPRLAPTPLPLKAAGRLARDRVIVDTAAVDAFGGHAQLAGEAQWSPAERWSLRGRASGVNPAGIRTDLPGKLDFEFESRGEGFDGDGNFELAVHDLSGRLRGVAASGGGHLARQGTTTHGGAPAFVWKLQDIRMMLGGTRLSADGSVADQLDLRLALDTEDLSLFAPGDSGHLHARATLKGTLQDPVVNGRAQGSDIHFGGIALQKLNASVDFDARSQQPSKIDIEARQLTWRDRLFDSLAFKLDGTAAAHVAHLNAKTGGLAVRLETAGAYAHGAWNGQLRAVHVDQGESLNLELDAPVALAGSPERAHVDHFCLHGTPAHVCAEGDWSPAKWVGAIEARDLPLGTLTAGLTAGVEYRGSLAVAANAFGGAGAVPQGNLRADLVDARILHRLASGRLQSILLGSGSVTANATPTSLDTQLEFNAGAIGTIKGRAIALRSTARWQDMPLSGELHAQTAELGFATLYAPQIDRAAGRLAADLALAGTAGTPLMKGSIKLSDAELDFYQVNLALRGLTLTADLKGNGLDFKSAAHIGSGEVAADGQLQWRESLPYGNLHLQGKNLRVVDVPEARIDASPDLNFKLAGRRIEATGTVAVPYAKIVPKDLRNAVRASSDEVRVGAQAEDPTKRFEVLSDITLSLGEKVSLDTLGLSGRLTGSLHVRSGYDPITHGTGELSVAEGKYTAYGRKLDIQRGRLIFSGGPVEDPGVDIRAIKQFPDALAGVNVRGTLQSPRTTFFSEPSLPQSQILSLILAGGSLGAVQNRQTGNELLAQGGAILAQQLGARVGLEDVSVESDLSNETSLVLGKYLSPRIYVSYGISLAESINTLKLRYSLNDRWTIKSEMGQARGADLVYTIEK